MISRYTPKEDLPEVLTPQEIADYMGVTRLTIYRLIHIPNDKGGIPFFSVGVSKHSSKRVVKKDFLRWLEKQTERGVMHA
ncbi:helix-turn-helix domain-containing protein [Paenibacillus sp. FSL R5-0490]|uniref:helix-turn-helix domain-containing protein n=1 Tax=Paenibacillus sp. FSL R5-0490 TaxID=1920424 RepID=UPI0030D3EE0E